MNDALQLETTSLFDETAARATHPMAPGVPRFRSTAAFALRRRSSAPMVERATFVTFSLGGRRFAAAVEAVERVLRWTAISADDAHVAYAGRDVPFADLAARLGVAQAPSAASRVLIVSMPAGWIAVVVDEVHEIATVDASRIATCTAEEAAAHVPGARGRFVRQDQETLVLDIARALGFRQG